MKIIILTLGLLFTTLGSIAQDSKVSITVAYPIPIGDNITNGYTGVADLGVQFRFIDAGPVKIGVSANASHLRNAIELGSVTLKESAFLVQPRVFAELNLESIPKFKPSVGLGYTFSSIKTTFDGSNGEPDSKNNYGGLNVNLGAAYNILNKWFVHLQYDDIKLSRKGQGQNLSFSSNITLLKVGLGLRF